MDLEAEENLPSPQNSLTESREQRKRHISDRDDYQNGSSKSAEENESAEDYAPPAKFRGIDVSSKVQLTDFPDEILYEIFKNLDTWTYYMLRKCCKRFATLLEDRRFWQHIDLSQKLLPLDVLEGAMKRAHKGTHSIKLRGQVDEYSDREEMMFNKTLTDALSIHCTQLSVLELRGVTVDMRNVRIVQFPKTLKRLVFRDCDVYKPPDEQTIFCGIHTHLVHLEELGIEFSNWFEPYHIMMISKIPSLRWLSLKGCKRFGDFIPYGSMAARFGFKKLEYLDLRFTPVNDADLQCFNVVFTLKELLLDCPVNTTCCHEIRCGTTVKLTRKSASTNDCQPSTSRASVATGDSETPEKGNSQEGNEAAAQHELCTSPQLASPTSSTTSSSSSSSSSSSPSSAMNSPSASPSHLVQEQPVENNLPLAPAGNAPTRFRFLPRPDQIILLDFVNRRPSIRRIRPLPNVENPLGALIRHPLFCDIINPLGRSAEGNRPCTAILANEINNRTCPLSDRAICAFGRPQNPVEAGVIWIRIGNRPSENSFVRLSVRNYKRVTDISLHHLEQCSPDLVYLDLSGTSVTREGIQRFKAAKPECQIIADHLIMTKDDEDCSEQNDSVD